MLHHGFETEGVMSRRERDARGVIVARGREEPRGVMVYPDRTAWN